MNLNFMTVKNNEFTNESQNDELEKRPPRPNQGSDNNQDRSARERACEGKKYGDDCSWLGSDAKRHYGRCFYARYAPSNGKLRCADRDYRDAEDQKSE